MKRIISLILSLIMVLALVPFSALTVGADETIIDGVLYSTSDDGTYYIATEASKTVTSVTIPETVNGLPVKEIGDGAFYYCSSLTSIEIPNSVTVIGRAAFSDCSSLTSVEIGDSVTTIGYFAFYSCSKLTSIEIPNSVTTIGNEAFRYCNSLTSIEIPNSVTVIGDSAFSYCDSLTSIEIPDSVTIIGYSAFYHCSSLTSVEMGNSVTTIGNSAFRYCNRLTSIEIPNSVTTIGNEAFYGCDSLTSVEIGNSVTTIGNEAFYGCDSLTSIEMGDSVTTIGDSAFEYCSSLTSIEISENAVLGIDVFCNCGSLSYTEYENIKYYGSESNPYQIAYEPTFTSLSSYTLHPQTKQLVGGLFYYYSKLTRIEIPNSVTTIGYYAFCGCSSLTSVEMGNSVTTIGDYAFYGCSSLTSIEIPNSVTTIGNEAFSSCDSLTDIYCEAESQPEGWADGYYGELGWYVGGWNYDSNATVHWGVDIDNGDNSDEPSKPTDDQIDPDPSVDPSDIMGEPNEDPTFTMDISVPEYYVAGEEVIVTVTVNNVNTALHHVHGELYFDASVLKTALPLKKDQELKGTLVPFAEWEDFCKVSVDENGNWIIEVDALTAGYYNDNYEYVYTDTLNDGDLVFNIKFIALADATCDTVVYIPHNTVRGAYVDPVTLVSTDFVGNGSEAIMFEHKDPVVESTEEPSESTEEPSSSEEPTEEPSEPSVDFSELLGEPIANPTFTMDISVPDYYEAGEEVIVTVTVNNVNTALHHVHGELYFDASVLKTALPLEEDQLLKGSLVPFAEWEDFTKISKDENGNWIIIVDALTAGYKNENGEYVYTDTFEDGDLVFNIKFIALEDATVDTVVYIPHNTVRGTYVDPVTFASFDYVGNGSMATIAYSEHICKGDGEWKYDEEMHWKSCSCGRDTDAGFHDFEWVVTSEPDVGVPGEKEYTCKTCGYVSETEEIPALEPEFLLGDVNGNGTLDTMDYSLLKRVYFGIYNTSNLDAGDINGNGGLDTMDYSLLKRVYFGIYII